MFGTRLESKTIKELAEKSEVMLNDLLKPVGVGGAEIRRMVDSGFIRWGMSSLGGPPIPVVFDTFYGNKSPSSMFTAERFARALQDDSYSDSARGYPKVQRISSLGEALDVISKIHSPWSRRLSYRGQTNRYFIERPFPNPIAARGDKREELIIPSFYRPYYPNFSDRPIGKGSTIFESLIADELIYDGIDRARLGSYRTIDEMEDSESPIDREYHKRYITHRLEAPFKGDYGILEQHYGIDTTGLDLTFDVATALFFATHRYVDKTDHATFEPVEPGDHRGVVYCFVFHDPPCRASSDIISELGVFEHMPARRPIAQQCTLRNFSGTEMNQAYRDLEVVLELDANFKLDGLPKASLLFPSPDEDPFYRSLLRLKDKWPEELAKIPIYRFE